MSKKIKFSFENIKVPDFNSEFFRLWINHVVKFHKKTCGDINYIFCDDAFILNINKEYLNHDYFTDIITFNYNFANKISGDIFISYETVLSNALIYSNGNVKDELDRVIIHGVLHLIGFNDKTEEEQTIMTKKEDEALSFRNSFT